MKVCPVELRTRNNLYYHNNKLAIKHLVRSSNYVNKRDVLSKCIK